MQAMVLSELDDGAADTAALLSRYDCVALERFKLSASTGARPPPISSPETASAGVGAWLTVPQGHARSLSGKTAPNASGARGSRVGRSIQ